MKKNIMKAIFGIGLMILTACGGGSEIDVSMNENIEIEYGDELDPAILYNTENDETLTVKEVKDFDNKKIGEQEITVIFALGEDTQEEKVKVNVKDTKAPEIKLKEEKLEITEGDEFDPMSNIESVKDPIDGEISQSDDKELTKNGYLIESNVDTAKAGEYTVTVTAFDINENKAEKTYKVTVKEKEEETSNTNSLQPIASQTQGSGSTVQSSQGSSSANNGGSQQSVPTQSQSKIVCPNGNEPLDPNLPCDAWYSGGFNQCYRDAAGNLVVFPEGNLVSTNSGLSPEGAIAAWDWAKEVMTNDRSFDIYSNFVTTPIGKNDNSHYYCVSFE